MGLPSKNNEVGCHFLLALLGRCQSVQAAITKYHGLVAYYNETLFLTVQLLSGDSLLSGSQITLSRYNLMW